MFLLLFLTWYQSLIEISWKSCLIGNPLSSMDPSTCYTFLTISFISHFWWLFWRPSPSRLWRSFWPMISSLDLSIVDLSISNYLFPRRYLMCSHRHHLWCTKFSQTTLPTSAWQGVNYCFLSWFSAWWSLS